MNKIPFEYGSIAENPFYRFGQMMTLKKIAKEYRIRRNFTISTSSVSPNPSDAKPLSPAIRSKYGSDRNSG